MISGADVARLLERPPTPGSPVLSVYLAVDQSRAVNRRREFAVALKAQLRTLEQQLARMEREAFRADAARAQAFVAGYEPHAKTLVLFADDSDALLWTGELRAALPTGVRWEPKPWVRPLLEAFDEHERFGVVLVDKERARVFTVFLGEIEEEREAFAAAEVRHKQASGTDHLRSQMNFQRQDDMHVRRHLRHVAELMEEVARGWVLDRLLLAGPVEATSELVRLLRHPLAERLVGTFRLPVDASADVVLRHALEAAERVEREAEETRVAQILERGAVGLPAVLAALQEGRVSVFVYAEGYTARGADCPRCHALLAADGGSPCAYCGEPSLPLDDLVGGALERAVRSGARFDMVRGEAAGRLLAAGGMGALLRF